MKYTAEIASNSAIYIPSFMKTDKGIEAVLRFYFSNLRCCNVGITDGSDL
jgi:hypothetical protein